MTDLVERLREAAAIVGGQGNILAATDLVAAADRIEADASRIRTLEAEKAELATALKETAECRDLTETQIAEQRDALQARVTALEAERAKAEAAVLTVMRERQEARKTALRLTDRVTALEGALRPFSDVSGEGDEDFPDGTEVVIKFGRTSVYSVTLGDFRRAALAKDRGDE